MTDVIAGMLASRRLERVAVNVEHALQVVTVAERHLRSAVALAATDDHAMAFTAAYDAARKALSAVLAAEGLRVRPVGGAHHNTGVAAAVFVADDSLREFDWMGQVRNATEYPQDDRAPATAQDVAEAFEAAGRIVSACAERLRSVT